MVLIKLNGYEQLLYEKIFEHFKGTLKIPFKHDKEVVGIDIDEIKKYKDVDTKDYLNSMEFIRDCFKPEGNEFRLYVYGHSIFIPALRINEYQVYYIIDKSTKYILRNFMSITQKGVNIKKDPFERYLEIIDKVLTYIKGYIDMKKKKRKKVEIEPFIKTKIKKIVFNSFEYYRELYNENQPYKVIHGNTIVNVKFGKINNLELIKPETRINDILKAIERTKEVNIKKLRIFKLDKDLKKKVEDIPIGSFEEIDKILYYRSSKSRVVEISFNPNDFLVEHEAIDDIDTIRDEIYSDIKNEVSKAITEKSVILKYFKDPYGTHQGLYMYKFTKKRGEDFDFNIKNDPDTNGDEYLDAAFWGERAEIGTTRLLKEEGDSRSIATMNIPFLKYMASKRINVSVKNIMNHHSILYPERPIVLADRNDIQGINMKTHIIGQGINIKTPDEINDIFEKKSGYITTEQGIKVDVNRYLDWMYRTYDAGIIISQSAANRMKYRHYTFINIDLQKHANKVVDIDILRRVYKDKKWKRPDDAERILSEEFDDLINQYYEYLAALRNSVDQLSELKKDIKTSATYLKLRDEEEELLKGVKVDPDAELTCKEYSEKYGLKIYIKGNADEFHVGFKDHMLCYWFEDSLKTGDKLVGRTGVKGVCCVMPDEHLMGYDMIIGGNKIGKSAILKEYEKSKEHGEKTTTLKNNTVEDFVNNLNKDSKKKGRPGKYKNTVIKSINMLKDVIDHPISEEDRSFILGIFKPADRTKVVDKAKIKKTEDSIEFNIKYKKRWIGGKKGKYIREVEERTINKDAIYLYDFMTFVTKKELKSEYINILLSFDMNDVKYMEDLLKGRVSKEVKWGYIFIQLQDAFSWNRATIAEEISLSDNFVEVLMSYPHTDPLIGHLFRKTDILGKKRISNLRQHLRYIWRDIKEIYGELELVELEAPKKPMKFKYGWITEIGKGEEEKIKRRRIVDAVIKHPIPSYYDVNRGIDRRTYNFFVPVREFMVEGSDVLKDEDVFDINLEQEEFDKSVIMIKALTKRNPLLYYQNALVNLHEFDPDFKNNKTLNTSIKDIDERKEFIDKIKAVMHEDYVEYNKWYYTRLINTHLFYYYGSKVDAIRESIESDITQYIEDKIEDDRDRIIAAKAITYEITAYINKIQRIFRTKYNTGFIATLDKLMSGKDKLIHSHVLRGKTHNGAFLTCIPRYIEEYDPPSNFNINSFIDNYNVKNTKSSYVVIHSSVAKKIKVKTGDWALLAREPISSRGSIKAYRIMVDDDKYPEVNKYCMLVNPNITKTYSMDFDGDTAILIPIKEFSLIESIYRQTLYFDESMGLNYTDLVFGEKMGDDEVYEVPTPKIHHETKKDMYNNLTELRFDDLMKNIYGVYYLGGKRKSLALHLQYFNKLYDNKWMTIDWINVIANIERIGMHKFKEKLKSYDYYEILTNLMNYLYGKEDKFKYRDKMIELIKDIDPDKVKYFDEMIRECRKPFGFPSENIYRRKQHVKGGSVGRRLKYFIEEYNKKDYSLLPLEDSVKNYINNQYYNMFFDDLTDDELSKFVSESQDIAEYIFNIYNTRELIKEAQEDINKLVVALENTEGEYYRFKIMRKIDAKKKELNSLIDELDIIENSPVKTRLAVSTYSKKHKVNISIDKKAFACPYNNFIKRRF